jgi:hypothetical protein
VVSRHAQGEWQDLRVIDEAGAEVPYVLTARTERHSREPRAARLLDLTYQPGGDTRGTVDLGAHPPVHNRVELQTPAQDFFVRVALDASQDGRDWREVEPGAPIYRFVANGLTGNQTVRYPPSTARYLRLRITDADERFPLSGVRAWHEIRRDPELVPVDQPLRPDPAAPASETWWVADRGARGQPLAEVSFTVAQPTFHRPVRVRTSDDGATWQTAGSGEIYRLAGHDGGRERLRVTFGETRARWVRVEVVNRSDAALTGATPRLATIPRRVAFRAEPGRRYHLLYGNARAAAPDYDLARVISGADLEGAPAATLDPAVTNAGYVDPAPWTERHPIVLWIALLAAVGVLGALALRALKASGRRPNATG